jgi:hypothetical protein
MSASGWLHRLIKRLVWTAETALRPMYHAAANRSATPARTFGTGVFLTSSTALFSAGGLFGNLIIGEVLLIMHNLLDHFADVRSQ